MINRKIRFTLYIIVAITLIGTYMMKDSKNDYQLPKLGSIPSFEFTDSDGNLISQEDLSGKIWVADFIFTTCTMACPVMTGNMNLIHKAFKNNDKVRIVSISVYPEYDTPEILKEYASRYNANTNRWHFLTGPEENVKLVIKNGFKMGDYEDIIFHSEKFALVDQNGNIRGYYNGIKTDDIKTLKKDIRVLLNGEY
ncbi:MAG: SCO family protein [Candidatus Marinimicrobia bacterium]|nr:SCO family protein [Candidatus Neomarinimicrobiota bacterium]